MRSTKTRPPPEFYGHKIKKQSGGEGMGSEEVKQLQIFMCDIRQQMGEVLGIQKMLLRQCEPRQTRLEKVEKTSIQAMDSAKSAHHRVDEANKNIGNVKKDIYYMAATIAGVMAFFVNIISQYFFK